MTLDLQTKPKIKTSAPRLAFLGVGWIGRNRMEAILKSNLAEIICIADPANDCISEAEKIIPEAKFYSSYEELISETEIDGIVIATPNAKHAEQSIRALENGLAVFCQKPLGRNFNETVEVVYASRRANRLLGIDLSYRYTEAFQKVLSVIRSGKIGKIFSVDLVFHNASGPGKQWFYDIEQSGGGCVIDLGIHLIDMALYVLNFPAVKNVTSKIYSKGNLITPNNIVEDYAAALIELDDGTTINLSCSWNLHAGKIAVIEASFHGTLGGAAMKNINGSYYDFTAELYLGTSTEVLCLPPDDWGGRAAVEWVKKLSANNNFDEEAEQIVKVSYVLDRIYGRM